MSNVDLNGVEKQREATPHTKGDVTFVQLSEEESLPEGFKDFLDQSRSAGLVLRNDVPPIPIDEEEE